MNSSPDRRREGLNGVVVLGCSAGGFKAVTTVLSALSANFPLPVLLVQHLHPDDDGLFAGHLSLASPLPVSEPFDKEEIRPGHVYVAPANYHMLVEHGGTVALSTDEKVHWSRPSIDVLFESAAHAFGRTVIAVIMTGASEDGSQGIRTIKSQRGFIIAEDPITAEFPFMPRSAVATGCVNEVLPLAHIGKKVADMARNIISFPGDTCRYE